MTKSEMSAAISVFVIFVDFMLINNQYPKEAATPKDSLRYRSLGGDAV